MLVDITLVNTYHKPYADSTLNNMKKSELIEYVRTLEYNYNVAVSFNEQQAKNFETMVKQKQGVWLPTNDNNKKRCSRCDVIHLIAQYPRGKINYCPNCGARMECE